MQQSDGTIEESMRPVAEMQSPAEEGPQQRLMAVPDGAQPAQKALAIAEEAAIEEAVVEETEELPVRVGVNDFRPRLIPSSRASLFRYALFGVAGLGFLGALAFLLAGIGAVRRN